MRETYHSELEAMRDFYEELDIIPDYSCNTDGVINGTLVEFKLNTISIPLKQLKRYIESRNTIALPLPHYSLFICINKHKFTYIDNSNWEIISDGDWENPKDLLKYFDQKEYLKGWIEEYSIISYNDLFYKQYLTGTKDAFIDEIQNPKELHIEPYNWNKKGDMEGSIIDCLGSTELKKRLGAFFTPDKYVEISTKYLRSAIARVPEGYDYIILDRCAGTGNLEKLLTNEELSHCVLNTYVYAEWTILKGLYEDRVRHIIPHTKDYKDPDGLLSDGNALTEEFNKKLTDFIEKERKKAGGKLVVIGNENNPFGEPQAEATRSGKTHTQNSWVKEQMKKEKKWGATTNDLNNQFIWSMTRYYCDKYIVFAPIKYWKSQHLFDGKFNEGYLCNRKHFHATKAAISLISWTNNKEKNDYLIMQSDLGDREIRKINEKIIKLNPININNGFASLYHVSGVPDFKNGALVNTFFKKHCSEIKLNNSNILQALPLWVANCYQSKDYTEKEVIMKSGDGNIEYQKDKEFLMDCFIWSCLIDKNRCISNDQVTNELCLNQNTEADKLYKPEKKYIKLIRKWYKILKFVETTKEYNPEYNYGLHQIIKEINIKIETGGYTKKGKLIFEHKYPDLNFMVKELKEQLKEFYDKYITAKLFEYELLK